MLSATGMRFFGWMKGLVSDDCFCQDGTVSCTVFILEI